MGFIGRVSIEYVIICTGNELPESCRKIASAKMPGSGFKNAGWNEKVKLNRSRYFFGSICMKPSPFAEIPVWSTAMAVMT